MTSAAKKVFHGFLSYCTALCHVFRLASCAPKYFSVRQIFFPSVQEFHTHVTAEILHFVLQFAQTGPNLF